jgi:hypothetical protein
VQESCKKGFPFDRAKSFLKVKFDENGRGVLFLSTMEQIRIIFEVFRDASAEDEA